METDASETPRARAHHVTDPLIEVDLATELESLRESDSYRAANHAATTIVKQPGIRVVLIALKPGGRLHEHHADAAITLLGVRGHVDCRVDQAPVVLTPGRLVSVAAGVLHGVTGVDESAFLLTIGGVHAVS